MSKTTPTEILCDTAILSSAIGQVTKEAGGKISKSRALNITAAKIAGEKHDWGFLTGLKQRFTSPFLKWTPKTRQEAAEAPYSLRVKHFEPDAPRPKGYVTLELSLDNLKDIVQGLTHAGYQTRFIQTINGQLTISGEHCFFIDRDSLESMKIPCVQMAIGLSKTNLPIGGHDFLLGRTNGTLKKYLKSMRIGTNSLHIRKLPSLVINGGYVVEDHKRPPFIQVTCNTEDELDTMITYTLDLTEEILQQLEQSAAKDLTEPEFENGADFCITRPTWNSKHGTIVTLWVRDFETGRPLFKNSSRGIRQTALEEIKFVRSNFDKYNNEHTAKRP